MGSVSSTSAGLSDILQTISNASPQLASVLSQSNVQSALSSASPSDLVELSDEAIQLQQVGLMFGDPATTSTSPTSLLQALESSSATTPTTSTNSASQLLESLFSATNSTDPLVNTLG